MTSPQKRPLRDALADALAEKDLAQTWQRVGESREAKTVRRARVRSAGVVLAVVAALAVGVGLWPRSGEQLLAKDGVAWQRVEGGQHLRLADESLVATTLDGEVEVLENARARLSLHLKRGGARFEVTPGTGRQWRVESAGVSVEVVGTIFTVQRRADTVEVTVERGVVVVRGRDVPDGVRRLLAGERLIVSPPVNPPGLPKDDSALVPLRATDVKAAPQLAPVVRAPLPPSPPPETRALRETAALLLTSADVARREGRVEEALTLLTTVVSRWPDSDEGPLAAFTAANMLAEAGREAARRALDGGATK